MIFGLRSPSEYCYRYGCLTQESLGPGVNRLNHGVNSRQSVLVGNVIGSLLGTRKNQWAVIDSSSEGVMGGAGCARASPIFRDFIDKKDRRYFYLKREQRDRQNRQKRQDRQDKIG